MHASLATLALSTASWIIRFKNDTQEAKFDLLLLFTFGVWNHRHFPLFNYISLVSFQTYFIIVSIITCIAFASFLYNVQKYGTRKPSRGTTLANVPGGSKVQILTPLVFPCRTSHTRMFPKKHSFSYSYLLVGIPVGWKGSVGSFLSADLESLSHGFGREHRKFPKTWLAVDAADYLNRGDGAVGLQGKLEEYLKSQVREPRQMIDTTALRPKRRVRSHQTMLMLI